MCNILLGTIDFLPFGKAVIERNHRVQGEIPLVSERGKQSIWNGEERSILVSVVNTNMSQWHLWFNDGYRHSHPLPFAGAYIKECMPH